MTCVYCLCNSSKQIIYSSCQASKCKVQLFIVLFLGMIWYNYLTTINFSELQVIQNNSHYFKVKPILYVCVCVCVCVCVRARALSHFSRVWLFVTLGTVARQAPLSIGFSRQEYWSGLLCPASGDLPNPGVEPTSPVLASGFLTTEPPGKPIAWLT